MKYGDKHMIHTDIYKPNPAKACERCCFGSGQHEPWCPAGFDVARAKADEWLAASVERTIQRLVPKAQPYSS